MSTISGVSRSAAASQVQVSNEESGSGLNIRIRTPGDRFTFSGQSTNRESSRSILKLNFALGTLATAQDRLDELLGFTETLIELSEKAAESSTSTAQRRSLDRKFKNTIEDFNDTLDEAADSGINFLNKEDLTTLLEFAGVNTDSATKLANTFQKLAGKDSILGFEEVNARTLRYSERLRTEGTQTIYSSSQVTDETNNAGNGISFAEVTNSTTNNVIISTEGTYSGNASANLVTGIFNDSETLSLTGDLSDESQKLLDVSNAGTTGLVVTGDAGKAALQLFTLSTGGTAPVFSSTITTLDTDYDSVKAVLSPDGTEYAYLSVDQKTINYYNGTSDNSFSVTGGTITDIDLANGTLFFTSDATSLSADGTNEDLFYIDTSEDTPTETRIVATTYTSETVGSIEQFVVTDDATRVAFALNEGADASAITAGLTKELVLLEIGSGDNSRVEESTGRVVVTPTGSGGDYKTFDFDSTGNFIYIAQQQAGDANSQGVAQFDITDITTPTYYDPVATGTFDAGTSYNFTSDTQVVAGELLDTDGDGFLDLVGQYSVNGGGSGIAIYRGDGQGGFSGVTTLGSGTLATDSIGVGEINGDAYTDIIVKSSATSVTIYNGNSSGTFDSGISYVVNDADNIRLADIDGDTYLDLVTSNNTGGSGEVEIRLGTGSGTFGSSLSYAAENNTTNDLQLIDIDGDTNLDLVTGGISDVSGLEKYSTVGVRVGNGDGTFGSYITGQVLLNGFGNDFEVREVKFADINGDGNLDAIATNTGSTSDQILTTSLGNGDGTFQAETSYAISADTGSQLRLEVGNINNDSSVDIVVSGLSSGAGFTEIFTGNGAGSFTSSGLSTNAAASDDFIALSDLDNDNILDVVQSGIDDSSGGQPAGSADLVVKVGDESQVAVQGTFSAAASVMTVNQTYAFTLGGIATSEVTENTFAYTTLNSTKLFDVDNDGILDSITSYTRSANPDGVAISLGNMDGTFDEAITLENTGVGIDSFTVADLDEDGFQDLIVGDGASIYSYSGNGDGTFNTNSTVLATLGYTSVQELTSADIDGDGNFDVVTAGNLGGTSGVEILYGDGTGSFSSQLSTAAITGNTAAENLVVRDVTGDGELDITYASENSGTVQVTSFINDGAGAGTFSSNGTFTATGDALGGIAIGNTGLSVNEDLALSISNGTDRTVLAYSGAGDGTFSLSFSETNSAEAAGNVTLFDIDNNGELDIVQGGIENTGSTGLIRTFLDDGAGSFNASNTIVNTGVESGRDVRIADINQDLAGDFFYNAAQNGTDGLNVRLGSEGADQLSYASEYRDIDGDGVSDIISIQQEKTSSTVSVSLGNTDGTFDAALTTSLSSVGMVSDLALEDINGDTELDLVYSTRDEPTSPGTTIVGVALGVGDGTFGAATSITAISENYSVTLADVVGDAELDLIVGGDNGSSGEVRIFEGNGDGTFVTATSTILSGEGDITTTVEAFDVDNDGDLDIITAGVNAGGTPTGSLGIQLNTGSGTFGSYVSYEIASHINTSITGSQNIGISIGDVNGDGDDDLVVAASDFSLKRGLATILEGDGTGTFTIGATYLQESYGSGEVVLQDINADGDLDLLTGGYADVDSYGEYSVRFGQGDGTFGDRTSFQAASSDVTGLFIGDADSDGNLEIYSEAGISGVVQISQREFTTTPNIAAGSIIRTGSSVADNVIASETTGTFGFSLTQSGVDEFFGATVSTAGKGDGLVGSSNNATVTQLTDEGTNGGTSISNAVLAAGDLFYTTTADYNSSNAGNEVGFTRQESGVGGFESVKLEISEDNRILDVDDAGLYALVQDFSEDSTISSLKVYNLSTQSVAYDVGEYLTASAGQLATGVIRDQGASQDIAFTQDGDTNSITFVNSATPETTTSFDLSNGSLGYRIVGSDSSVVFTATTTDFSGTGVESQVFYTDSFASTASATAVSLGGTDVNANSVSVSGDGSIIAAATTAGDLSIITDTGGGPPTVTSTGIGNIEGSALSSDGSRLAVLQNNASVYTVSVYDVSGTSLTLDEATVLDATLTDASSLSISADGTQIGLITTTAGAIDEFTKIGSTTVQGAESVIRKRSASSGNSGKVDPLLNQLDNRGNALLASVSLPDLKDEIEEDLDEIRTVLDELATAIKTNFNGITGELRNFSTGLNDSQLLEFAKDIADQIRGSSYEPLLLANEIDAQTALELLREI